MDLDWQTRQNSSIDYRSCISIHHHLQRKDEGMNPHYDYKYDSIPSFPTEGPPTSLPFQTITFSNKIYADNILQACFFGQDLADGKQTYPGVKPALPTKVLLRTGWGRRFWCFPGFLVGLEGWLMVGRFFLISFYPVFFG